MNQAGVGITIQTAHGRLKQVQNCLESLIANTDVPYRLIWHAVSDDPETTTYLIQAHLNGKIQHLFLHRPDDDWRAEAMQNLSAKILAQHLPVKGVNPIEWLVLCCDDMEFQPGWLSHSLATIDKFQDLPIALWSPYRPPEHEMSEYLERDGVGLMRYVTLAPRCCFIKNALFLELGGWPLDKGHVADWHFIMTCEARGLGFAVIPGLKVLHRDWGWSPAHGQARMEGEHTDDYMLRTYGGYRGDPGTTWPTFQRPAL